MVIPAEVDEYRTHHRERISTRYNGWLHFALTTIGSLVAIGYALSRVHSPWLLELLCIPVFFLIANFGEYLAHRYPMHQRTPGIGLLFERHSEQHHRFYTYNAMASESPRDFQMVLFPPIMLVLFLGLVAPIAFLIGTLGTANLGWLFCATAVSYFLTYEWLHWAYHQPEDSWAGRLALVRSLRRHHTSHHLESSVNFNITFPIADRVFGTSVAPR